MTERDRVESGRRGRAALAYSGRRVRDIAKDLNVSEMTVHRILAGTRKETSWDELWRIADLCGVPREWFGADFSRLAEIVPEGYPVFGQARDRLKREMEQELEEHVQRARSRAGAAAQRQPGPLRKGRAS